MRRLADEAAGIVETPSYNSVSNEAVKKSAVNDSEASEKKSGELDWKEQKRIEAEKRKKEKEISNLEAQMSEAEKKLSELQNKLADPSVYSVAEKAKAVQSEIKLCEKSIEELTEKWETLVSQM